MNYTVTVKKLEAKYKVKKGKTERYPINKENIPAKFWVLLPYLEYYSIYSREEREAFCEKLPEVAFKDLDEVLESLEPEPGLISWLGGPEAKKKKLTDEFLALTILVEVRDNYISYDDNESTVELTKLEKERLDYILKLNQSELRDIWEIKPDEFQRIDFDASKLPVQLQPLKAILNIVAIRNRAERDAFEEQNSGLAKVDILIVKKAFGQKIADYCSDSSANSMIEGRRLDSHEAAIDLESFIDFLQKPLSIIA